jgi:hypothetical protein
MGRLAKTKAAGWEWGGEVEKAPSEIHPKASV